MSIVSDFFGALKAVRDIQDSRQTKLSAYLTEVADAADRLSTIWLQLHTDILTKGKVALADPRFRPPPFARDQMDFSNVEPYGMRVYNATQSAQVKAFHQRLWVLRTQFPKRPFDSVNDDLLRLIDARQFLYDEVMRAQVHAEDSAEGELQKDINNIGKLVVQMVDSAARLRVVALECASAGT